ncbi:hypothetical protein WA588_005553, partial [Blastocystis sp. NMH]
MGDYPTTDCYEILGVEQDATIDVIKKAYRKLALKWHPDKNPDRMEEATKQFQMIGRAWEILSDPQERAWYDEHRDSINGGMSETMNADDFCAFMMPYFSPMAFFGFGDDANGFYSVFSRVFSEILAKERQSDKSVHLPSFGSSMTTAADVLLFYRVWSSFVTCRSFASADVHNVREAPNRYVRRAMEKENNKSRDDSRKQYNAVVLRLVETCKKQDPRYQEAIKSEKEQRERREAEQRERQKEAKLRREEELRGKMQTGVTQTEDAERAFKLDDTVNEETGTWNLYECVVCQKVFKKESQLRNHEQSKKHLQAVEELRREMEMEEMMLHGGVEEKAEDHVEKGAEDVAVGELHAKEAPTQEFPAKEALGEDAPAVETNDHTENAPESEHEDNTHSAPKLTKKQKKQKKRQAAQTVEMSEEMEETGEMSVLDIIEQMNSQNMRGRKAKNMNIDETERSKKGKKG